MVDPFFLELCSLGAAKTMFESREPPALLVAGSPGLASALAEVARKCGLYPVVRHGAAPGVRTVAAAIHAAAAIAYFCVDGMLLRTAAVARQLRGARPTPAQSDRPQTMLMTFFGESQMSAEGGFKDVYFPGLREWLETRGFETWTYPFFASRRRLIAKYLWLSRTGERFLIPEDWLKAADYLAALRVSMQLLRLPRHWGAIEGLDVSPLVREARRRQAAENGPRLATLVSRFPARLASAGFRPAHVIAWAENQVHDKALFLGSARAFPKAHLTGVQNTPLFPNLTNSFRLPTESRLKVGGDRVATSGPLPADILSKASGDSVQTISACGLRYAYLRQEPRKAIEGKHRVVVALPLIIADANELLEMVLPVCRELVDVQWVFKSHPHYRFEQASDGADLGVLPRNARVVGGALGDHLHGASALITTGSGTALEAAALGIPVIVSASRWGLTFNPLAWFDSDRRHEVHSSEELTAKLTESLTPEGVRAAAEFGRLVLDGWFAPVDDAGLSALLA
jgi:hypothetical protein